MDFVQGLFRLQVGFLYLLDYLGVTMTHFLHMNIHIRRAKLVETPSTKNSKLKILKNLVSDDEREESDL